MSIFLPFDAIFTLYPSDTLNSNHDRLLCWLSGAHCTLIGGEITCMDEGDLFWELVYEKNFWRTSFLVLMEGLCDPRPNPPIFVGPHGFDWGTCRADPPTEGAFPLHACRFLLRIFHFILPRLISAFIEKPNLIFLHSQICVLSEFGSER